MNGQLLLVLAVLAAVALYALDLRRRPFGRCWRCKGSGRVTGSTSKRWGPCPQCDGGKKPPRQRIGARMVRPELKERKK